ncbi:MAG: hypothetical protein GXX99_01480 [Clostridiales bacterium]|nr:hypothetical protein [Clostridiales bacterium]
MFGYVTALQPELRVRELHTYKAIYCGLCRRLKLDYGLRSTLALSYDFVFLAALGLSLSEEEPLLGRGSCPALPLRRKACIEGGEPLHYAAAMQLLLGAAKLEDDAEDEPAAGRAAARAALSALHRAREQATRRYPEQAGAILRHTAALRAAERGPACSLDGYAHHSGALLADLAAPLSQEPATRRILMELGYQLGRFIYLIDALDDLLEDARCGRFNPLQAAGYTVERCAQGEVSPLLSDAAQAAARALQLLPARRYLGILENILQHGLRQQALRVECALRERTIKEESPT